MNMLTVMSNQLFTRPADEHFPSMSAVLADAKKDREGNRTVTFGEKDVLFLPDGRIALGDDQPDLTFTNLSLTQAARFAKIPMQSLERMTDETRTKVLNELFPRDTVDDDEAPVNRVALVNGSDQIRALTSAGYSRLWDAEILGEINRWVIPNGWQPAVPEINQQWAKTNPDGDGYMPALFRGDQDMFCFFMGPREDDGGEFGGLRPGIIVFNSEVGVRSFGWMRFYFRGMCANFLIWNALAVALKRAVHRGKVRNTFDKFRKEIVEIGTSITTEELDKIQVCREQMFVPKTGASTWGDAKAEIAGRLFKNFGMTHRASVGSVEFCRAPENEGTNLGSYWNVSNAVTSFAKGAAYASQRVEFGRIAGAIMDAGVKEAEAK